jgi:geranylgeranyl diphosphate synthase, type II
MYTIESLQSLVAKAIVDYSAKNNTDSLQEPIHYLLGLGGKRMRPALTLLATDLFGGDVPSALPAAMSIEVFHNFTLMHDDIMDNAPLRRGNVTVHEKWNTNTAILSGDAMLIEAYQLLCGYSGSQIKQILPLFNDTALGVCKGQQMDMEFEKRSDVSVEEYIEMIRLKTAVLLGGALEIGGIIANATAPDLEHIRLFGEKLGISFQLRDDYLDAFGDPENFGKQVGGDILSDKKTYLYLTAIARCDAHQKAVFEQWHGNTDMAKIEEIKSIMIATGADQAILAVSQQYYEEALNHLDRINVTDDRKATLRALAAHLLHREV